MATSVGGLRELNSALERRAEVHERRAAALRRRTRRIASRFGLLLGVDIASLVFSRFFLEWLAINADRMPRLLGTFRTAGPLANPGEPASMVFWVAVPIALLVTGAYSRHRGLNTSMRLVIATVAAAAAATIPLAAVVGLQGALVQMGVVAVLTALVLIPGRWVGERFLRQVWPRDLGAAPAILIGPPDAVHSRVASAVTAGGGDYRIAAHWQVSPEQLGEPQAFARNIGAAIEREGAEALILTDPLSTRHLHALVEAALSAGCLVLCRARAVVIEGLRPRLAWHHDQPLLEFGTPVLQVSALLTKRFMDVIGAGLLLILASPLMLLIIIVVKIDSPGPAFFSQDRAGLGGRRFRMLKFRTMRTGADQEKQDLAHLNHTGDLRLFKIPEDPRVTRFGKFLRRWSMDELPQFWNVLRGDMSLVGPRPFFESDFAEYDDHHFRRLDTKPGITGLWQVGGRSDVVRFEDVVYLDRQYIEHWSAWLDLSILLRTLPSVLRRTGAY